MKKLPLLFFCIGLFVCSTLRVAAQEQSAKTVDTASLEVDDAPVIYTFEPDFLTKNKQRRAKIAQTRKIIDTLNISDRKRRKLIKDLYKNGLSKRLQKALLIGVDSNDDK